jgi:hypothetical protein
MSLFGFGNRHTEIVQLEELNFVSFEELLNTNNTFVEANNNKEVKTMLLTKKCALFILCDVLGYFRGDCR